MKLDTMEVGPRTILTNDGAPVLVTLMMRESRTPGRIKAALIAGIEEEDGTVEIAPMPFSVPTVTMDGKRPRGFNPEWRMEMN